MQLQINLETTTHTVIDEIQLLASLRDEMSSLPMPSEILMPGILWGNHGQLYTPAYWKLQYLMHGSDTDFQLDYKLGKTINEEVIACLLGGFGLKAEHGVAAFHRLQDRNLIKYGVAFEDVLNALIEPLIIKGKQIRYRFPNQKAKFITEFLNRSDLEMLPIDNDIQLRNWLTSINGIGPKTASWITRNYLDSENVAIIDVHIFRACIKMGLYSQDFDIQKDYYTLEQLFLDFCLRLGVQPSKMDALIWLQMKDASRMHLT